jgi:hypothetical protein
MNIKRLAVFVSSLSILIAFSQAQVPDLFEKDGNDWNMGSIEFLRGMNIGMVQGFIMGTSLIYNEIGLRLERLAKSKTQTDLGKSSFELQHKKMEELTLFGISSGQLKDGIDVPYKDFSNRRIKIIDAFFIVKMQIEGKDPNLIQAQIRYLRMHPINDKAYEEAQKKMDAIYFRDDAKSWDYVITNEHIKSGAITEQELLTCGIYVDKNNLNHYLFSHGEYK